MEGAQFYKEEQQEAGEMSSRYFRRLAETMISFMSQIKIKRGRQIDHNIYS